MISSEVQRTLVKSPPELWAELSDPASLARHLGELGEIRITRAEPEKLVEWEAEAASGTVAIKASGWGTKVTLTANREFAHADTETQDAESEHATDARDEATATGLPGTPAESVEATQAVETAEPQAPAEAGTPDEPLEAPIDTRPAPDVELEASAGDGASEAEEPEAIAEAPLPEPDRPERRPGFFARLFGRGRHRRVSAETPTSETEAAAATVPPAEPPPEEMPAESGAPEDSSPADNVASEASQEGSPASESSPQAGPHEPEASDTAPAEPLAGGEDEGVPTVELDSSRPDLAAELRAAEEAAEAEVTAILTGVLDRLGAAHHRPFSRA